MLNKPRPILAGLALGLMTLVAVPAAPSLAQTPANAVTDFRTYTRDLDTLSGRFVQEVKDKNGRVTRQSSGQFVLARPGRFRFEYDKPYPQTIVSDGKTVWLHDVDLNQVTIRKIGDAVGEQPLALLLDPAALDKTFTLTALEAGGSVRQVAAAPRNPDANFSDLVITLVGLEPESLAWRDAMQNANTLRFDALDKNARVDPARFSFTPPPGTDVLQQ